MPIQRIAFLATALIASSVLAGCAGRGVPEEIASTAHSQLSSAVQQVNAKSAAESKFYDDMIKVAENSHRMRRSDDLIARAEGYAEEFAKDHPDGASITDAAVRAHMAKVIEEWSERETELQSERSEALGELRSARANVALARQDLDALEAKLSALSKSRNKKQMYSFYRDYAAGVVSEFSTLQDATQ